VEAYLEKEREVALDSPMPAHATAEGGVYCEEGCHEIKPKYGTPKVRVSKSAATRKKEEAAIHFK
jgi:hypothetical protein